MNLYNFQREDVDKMKEMPHVLLFSDMGTGKTVEAIKHVSENNLLPCLVLCPKSLKYQWEDEIIKWTGVSPLFADNANAVVEYYFDMNVKKEDREIFYILHHDALARIQGVDQTREILLEMNWKSIIIDECQFFRNVGTYRTKALMSFRDKSKKIFMSGTPIVNSNFDLFFIMKMLGLETSQQQFLENYTRGMNTNYGYKIISSKNKEVLLEKIAPYYIRRTKQEVMKELPELTKRTLKLEMPEDQREIYSNFEEALCMLMDNGEELTAPNVLTALTRLRQLSLHPLILNRESHSSKLKAIEETIEQAPKEKWIIASTSKQFIDVLEDKMKIPIIKYSGDDNIQSRHNKLQNFFENPNKNVIAMTMHTGGIGLNLQEAHNMIITDYWWNFAILEQQIARIHRSGQKEPSNVFILHNNESIDDDMLAKCSKKEETANEIVIQQQVMEELYKRRRGISYKEQYDKSHY